MSIFFILLGLVCFVWLYAVINLGRYQKMPIMNIVWPTTGLYLGPFALWAFYGFARMKEHSYAAMLFKAGLHCASGCVLGDFIAELCIHSFGWQLFGSPLYTSYIIDFIFAFCFGIAFQYASQPKESRSLLHAIGADFFSLVAFQVGMYLWTGFVYFTWSPSSTESFYWAMMQVAMICGLITNLPMNALLIRLGIKKMCCH